jgi:hypothetical protein
MVRSGDFLRVPFFLRKNGHESIDSLYTLREFALISRPKKNKRGAASKLRRFYFPSLLRAAQIENLATARLVAE